MILFSTILGSYAAATLCVRGFCRRRRASAGPVSSTIAQDFEPCDILAPEFSYSQGIFLVKLLQRHLDETTFLALCKWVAARPTIDQQRAELESLLTTTPRYPSTPLLLAGFLSFCQFATECYVATNDAGGGQQADAEEEIVRVLLDACVAFLGLVTSIKPW
uniref:Uncharacterized protein n=1 Tax=Chromera velia CCMP2878 TaxID=1169474 RepID=A0A0G4F857_9ALVE|eukprot:Cvel_2927.t1-p1 / transcript=Cvel_2927.t1 / gene=Cvel_2927 / organism=Chromera_velia_CCMP2878 / gene_product=hypothetical protein / transcript_product=hypothetical protein / location=Cvel_scaffold115:118229-118711(-) / protein_length=161 / sequence_SO=supercontig / SO=protein_coding / is_pseudo=false